MGYGHGWSAFSDLPDAFVIAVRQVLTHVGWALNDVTRDGARMLIVTPPGGYELMTLGNAPGACATGGGFTDTVVVAVLTLAAHFGLTTVHSAGDRSDWEERVAWARNVTGLNLQIPATIREVEGVEDESDDDIPF